ncbi:MAG TPA: YrhK family protein [Trueperaceae bacterium]|nr:YrhK family protein [Trueperaceae bacterium]
MDERSASGRSVVGRSVVGRAVVGRAVLARAVRERAARERSLWDAERLQAALNVFAGVTFSGGSLLFLDSSLMRLGVALFVLGSVAMAAGAILVWRQRYARGPAGVRVTGLEPPPAGSEPAGRSGGDGAVAPLTASAAPEAGDAAYEERYLRAS